MRLLSLQQQRGKHGSVRSGAGWALCAAGAAVSGALAAHFSWGVGPRFAVAHAPEAVWLQPRSLAYQSPASLEAGALRALSEVVQGLLLITVITAFVGLIALLLAVASRRQRELATRAALGAAPAGLLRLLARPIVRTSVVGGAVGFAVAAGLVAVVQSIWPGSMLDGVVVRIGRALAGAAVFALSGALASIGGLWFFVMRTPLARALSAGERASADAGETRVRELLLVLQTAACVVLVAVALSLAPTRREAGGAEQQVRNVSVARVEVRGADAAARARALAGLLEAGSALPGVQAESLASAGAVVGVGPADVIYSECDLCVYSLGRLPYKLSTPGVRAVGPGYFEAIGQGVLQGRGFSGADTLGAEPVAVINRSFAVSTFARGRALGRVIRLKVGRGDAHRIVGVVADRRGSALGASAPHEPMVYLSALQYPPTVVDLIARAGARSQGGIRFEPWSELQARAAAPITIMSRGVTLLALLCFLLAAQGVFAVVRALIAGARSELQIRWQLGARPDTLVRLLVTRCATIALAGAGAGALAAFAALRIVQAVLPAAPVAGASIAGAAALLVATAMAAALAPALRAGRAVSLNESA